MSRKLTRVRIAAMIACLASGHRTKAQLAKRIGISRTSANEWVNVLHEARCLHIKGYVFTRSNGYQAAVYAWGPGEDALKPRPKTSTERVYKARGKTGLDQAWKPNQGV